MSHTLDVSVMDIVLQRAIEPSLPSSVGQRNRKLFKFARLIKSIPQLAGLEAIQLEPYVREWHRRALSHITTKEFDVTMADFVRAYPKVRHSAEVNLLEIAMKRAREAPLPVCAMRFENECTRRLVGLCAQLQLLQGDVPFFVSYRDAGAFIERSHQDAGSLLGFLVATGVLKKVRQGGCYNATRYRYLGDPACSTPAAEPDADDQC